MLNNNIISDSLIESIKDIKELVNMEYATTRHFQVQMENRGININEINTLIENGMFEEGKENKKKEFSMGLVIVYTIEDTIKTLITCYRSTKDRHNVI